MILGKRKENKKWLLLIGLFVCVFGCKEPILQEQTKVEEPKAHAAKSGNEIKVVYEKSSLKVVDDEGREYSNWLLEGKEDAFVKTYEKDHYLVINFYPSQESRISFFGLFDQQIKKGIFHLLETEIPFKTTRFGSLSENGRFVLLLGSGMEKRTLVVYQRNQKKLFEATFAGKDPRWLPNHQLLYLSEASNNEGKHEGLIWTQDGVRKTGEFFKVD